MALMEQNLNEDGLGDLIYDKDAVYININDHFVKFSKDDGDNAEEINKEVTLEIRNFSPTHFLFKIESFSLLSQNGVNKYESNEFSAGNYKWRLIFNFNWEDNGNEVDNVAIYLALANSSSLPTRWEVNAVFSIFLYNQSSDNFLSVRGPARRFHALKTEWGFSKFISKKSLIDPCNGYLVNDNCVFGAEVFVIKPQGVIERLSMLQVGKPEDHSWSISQFSKLKNGWFSEEFLTRDHKWKMQVYPRGQANAKDGYISIFLCLVNSIRSPFHKVKISCTMKIKDQKNGKHKSGSYTKWFTYSGKSWGWSKFMSISDMNNPVNGYLVKDCCILEVQISVQAVAHSVII